MTPQSEEYVKQQISLAAARRGHQMWRNNVGVATDATGRVVRYGLANVSKQMNAKIKSSDYIGITPVKITQDMVGQTIGVFTAIEAKRSDWTFRPNDMHTQAQSRFIQLVTDCGGLGGFARSVDDFNNITGTK